MEGRKGTRLGIRSRDDRKIEARGITGLMLSQGSQRMERNLQKLKRCFQAAHTALCGIYIQLHGPQYSQRCLNGQSVQADEKLVICKSRSSLFFWAEN